MDLIGAGEGEIRMENMVQPDSDWIPNCLIELYADKLFIPLPDGADRNAMMREGAERFLAMP